MQRLDDLPVGVQLLLGALGLQVLLSCAVVALVGADAGLPREVVLLLLLLVLGFGLGLAAGLGAWLVLRRSRVAWTLLLVVNLPTALGSTEGGRVAVAVAVGSSLLVLALLVLPSTLRTVWAGHGVPRGRPAPSYPHRGD